MTEDELYQKLSDPTIPVEEKKHIQEKYNDDHRKDNPDRE